MAKAKTPEEMLQELEKIKMYENNGILKTYFKNVLAFIMVTAINAVIVMFSWNYIVPTFGIQQITYLQAFLLIVLIQHLTV